MNINAEMKVHNYFTIEIEDASGQKRTETCFNLVLNQGYDRLLNGTGIPNTIHFGSGRNTPAVTDTALQAKWTDKTVNVARSVEPEAMRLVFDYAHTFSPEEFVGKELSEIGLGVGGTLYTRALITDVNNNPITLVKTDTERWHIKARCYLNINVVESPESSAIQFSTHGFLEWWYTLFTTNNANNMYASWSTSLDNMPTVTHITDTGDYPNTWGSLQVSFSKNIAARQLVWNLATSSGQRNEFGNGVTVVTRGNYITLPLFTLKQTHMDNSNVPLTLRQQTLGTGNGATKMFDCPMYVKAKEDLKLYNNGVLVNPSDYKLHAIDKRMLVRSRDSVGTNLIKCGEKFISVINRNTQQHASNNFSAPVIPLGIQWFKKSEDGTSLIPDKFVLLSADVTQKLSTRGWCMSDLFLMFVQYNHSLTDKGYFVNPHTGEIKDMASISLGGYGQVGFQRMIELDENLGWFSGGYSRYNIGATGDITAVRTANTTRVVCADGGVSPRATGYVNTGGSNCTAIQFSKDYSEELNRYQWTTLTGGYTISTIPSQNVKIHVPTNLSLPYKFEKFNEAGELISSFEQNMPGVYSSSPKAFPVGFLGKPDVYAVFEGGTSTFCTLGWIYINWELQRATLTLMKESHGNAYPDRDDATMTILHDFGTRQMNKQGCGYNGDTMYAVEFTTPPADGAALTFDGAPSSMSKDANWTWNGTVTIGIGGI